MNAPADTRDAERDAARAKDRAAVARWIADFQAGRDPEAAFRALYERYRRPLLRFFARKGLPADECLDLTQETFLGIHRGLEGYRPEARFETWLFRIATNAFLKSRRARTAAKRRGDEVSTEELTPAQTPEADDDPCADMLDAERRRRLRRAVSELPEQMRRCLVLRLYQQLGYREIATVLRLSVDTVKSHLRQGRHRLRQRLEAGT